MLALFVALGGTGYAAAKIGANDLKDGAVRSRHVKDGTLIGADLKRDSVGGPRIVESSLGKVPAAVRADNGIRAYAHVLSDGTLDLAASRNVLDVRPRCTLPCSPLPARATSAWQCFRLPFSPNGGVANTSVGAADGVVHIQIPPPEASDDDGCPPGFQAEAFTLRGDTGYAAPAEFYVVFY